MPEEKLSQEERATLIAILLALRTFIKCPDQEAAQRAADLVTACEKAGLGA